MRVYFTMPGVNLRVRREMEERLRLILGSWSSHIRQARVYIQDVDSLSGGVERRCSIEAKLIPSVMVCVQALATDVDTALERAGRRLVVLVKDECPQNCRNAVH